MKIVFAVVMVMMAEVVMKVVMFPKTIEFFEFVLMLLLKLMLLLLMC